MTARGTAVADQAPIVVCIHGICFDNMASYYFTLGFPFTDAGFDVILYDLRGHGKSERPPSGYTLDTFVADLDALLDQLDIRRPVHLVGNSYGGTVAFNYAVRRPDRTATVTMIESRPATEAWASFAAQSLQYVAANQDSEDNLLARWVAEASRTGPLRSSQYAHFLRIGKAAEQLMRTTTVVRDVPVGHLVGEDEIRAVRCPVLLIYGSDGLVTDVIPWVESLLPNCRSAVLPGLKHSVLLDAPAQVHDLIVTWISEHTHTETPRGGGDGT
ncbi:hypothetical protein AWN90_37250 [Nocardia terpenica]|uniref:AB hydrolase-1 domain-containing protein n=1 Tax=Nocardia terpenica TaxID=455432 RepID=A0A161XEU5_9NOCA|nr:hypothetical protein AWN90_37250 [Nocardia terpenica]